MRGNARLAGERRVVVTAPDGAETEFVAGIAPWTSRDATSATAAPESLAILGGDVVGSEMATAYADFGTRVALVARGGLLSGFESFAGDAARRENSGSRSTTRRACSATTGSTRRATSTTARAAHPPGTARAVIDVRRRVLVGPGVGELLHAATIAIVGEVPLDRLWHAAPAYPTLSEIWVRLLETYGR